MAAIQQQIQNSNDISAQAQQQMQQANAMKMQLQQQVLNQLSDKGTVQAQIGSSPILAEQLADFDEFDNGMF